MNRWVGRWTMIVGIIHCIVGAVLFREPLMAIMVDGLWNAVDGYPGRPLAFWFLMLGMLTILFGALIDWVEVHQGKFPATVAVGFLSLTVIGVVCVPAGGGWLLIPSAVGLLAKRKTSNGV